MKKTMYAFKEWVMPVVRTTKLKIKSGNMTFSVELSDASVKETIMKLLENFTKSEAIDLLSKVISEKPETPLT